jgi:hypothetical protein
MSWFRTLAISTTSIAVIAAQSIVLHAQAVSPPSQGPTIAVSLALEQGNVPVGQMPRAVLTIKNIGQEEKCFRTASSLYRVHVEGKKGGPPETEFQRHLRGEFRPGEAPEPVEGPANCVIIPAGGSVFLTYDLAMFYDLSVPGIYGVYIDILDESKDKIGSGVWLRTNTAQFEMQAATP